MPTVIYAGMAYWCCPDCGYVQRRKLAQHVTLLRCSNHGCRTRWDIAWVFRRSRSGPRPRRRPPDTLLELAPLPLGTPGTIHELITDDSDDLVNP